MSIAVPLYGFGASGGSPNKSTIIVTAPTGSTVTCKMGSIAKTATEKNGVWTFSGLGLGTWTITSTKGSDTATRKVTLTRITIEYVTITYFSATISITYPTGSTCTCTNGSINLIAPDTTGSWVCIVPSAGNWTVTSTNGDKSKSADVLITTDGQTESVTLQYITYLFKDGETYDSLTGGWQGVVDAGKKAIRIDAPAEKTGFAYPKSKIDLTNYNTISAVVTENVSASSAFSLYITEAIGHSAVASVILGAAPATRVDLDVSSVTGSYYVMTSLYSEKGGSVYVTEVSMQ